MTERTIRELVKVLHDDYRRCYKAVFDAIHHGEPDSEGYITADDQFECRQFMRALFSYFEGVVFALKLTGLDDCIEKQGDVAQGEAELVFEVKYDIDDKGSVIEQFVPISLIKNIKFAFNLYSKAHDIANPLDTSKEWWFCLKRSIAVRNRIVHPKQPEDLDVEPREIIDAIKAQVGFDESVMLLLGDTHQPETSS